jgi:hypothetical protein
MGRRRYDVGYLSNDVVRRALVSSWNVPLDGLDKLCRTPAFPRLTANRPAALERLARFQHDFLVMLASLLSSSRVGGAKVVVQSERRIMAMVADEERRMISQRTKDALAAAKKLGTKLGGHQAQGHRQRCAGQQDLWRSCRWHAEDCTPGLNEASQEQRSLLNLPMSHHDSISQRSSPNATADFFNAIDPLRTRGRSVWEPIACPLSLAAPLQSARLQTSVRHFLWGVDPGPPRRCQP